ncbi:MAG: SagB/ThcOx family dehydrogenase [Pyramidobacter sp.]
MDSAEVKKLILEGRNFMHYRIADGYQSDQTKKIRQPPLVKEPVSDTRIQLPVSYEKLEISGDFLTIINTRRSHRVYASQPLSLLQLSYLLWCTQGVRDMRGKAYATLRTVPSAGARHPFETYLAVRSVTGLEQGYYHYLPMSHSLELLKKENDESMRGFIAGSLHGQAWTARAGVVFYYSMVFYRAEWRYGFNAHRTALIDAGHVTENLYLACTSLGLGGCAVAALDSDICDSMFNLDGKEETIFYAMPVGTVRAEDEQAEKDFYAFVKEQGL